MAKPNVKVILERKEAISDDLMDPKNLQRGNIRGNIEQMLIVEHDFTNAKQFLDL
jgi:hypothetical protein